MSITPITRQFIFFVLAVMLPSSLLLAFGVVLMRQENELAARRMEETRSSVAREAADSLLKTLEDTYSAVEPNGGRYSGYNTRPAHSGQFTRRRDHPFVQA